MIWRSESVEQKAERLMQWHPWFAWFPVRAEPAGSEGKLYAGDHIVWMRTIERKASAASWDGNGGMIWYYRVTK